MIGTESQAWTSALPREEKTKVATSRLFERMILMDFLSSGLGYYFILFVSLLLTLGSQSYINSAYRKTKKILYEHDCND